MPYKVVKSDSCPSSRPWTVVKSDGGKKVGGCHPSKGKAEKQKQAIEINEGAHGALQDRIEHYGGRDAESPGTP